VTATSDLAPGAPAIPDRAVGEALRGVTDGSPEDHGVCDNLRLSMIHVYRVPQPDIYAGSYKDDSPEMVAFMIMVYELAIAVLAEDDEVRVMIFNDA
jgi:hypothetical protein